MQTEVFVSQLDSFLKAIPSLHTFNIIEFKILSVILEHLLVLNKYVRRSRNTTMVHTNIRRKIIIGATTFFFFLHLTSFSCTRAIH